MALISCPECKCEVSDVAVSCPKCGYPINPVKHKRKRPWILVIIVVLQFIGLLFLGSMLYSYYPRNTDDDTSNAKTDTTTDVTETSEFDIFQYTSDNKYEPFALTAENNILGKDISVVLDDYFSGKEHTYESDEYFCSYTFTEPIEYPIGSDSQLAIYTDVGSFSISMVEYSFRTNAPSSNSDAVKLYRLIQEITDYYDVEPSFAYINEEMAFVSFSGDNFTNFVRNNKYLYYITWETDSLLVNLYIPNTTDYKKLECSISYLLIDEQKQKTAEN